MQDFYNHLKQLKKAKGDKLCYIHTPKAYGTFVNTICKDLGIMYIGHKRAVHSKMINFTVVRNPVDRFISLINYRLQEKEPRADFPERLHPMHYNRQFGLEEIITQLTHDEILSFKPFRTLEYWTQGCDAIITLNQVQPFLAHFGHEYDQNLYPPLNVSKKERSQVSNDTRKRLEEIFSIDMVIWNKANN